MRRLLPDLTFISIILLLSFVLNFYVLWRMSSLFKIKRDVIFWIIYFVCASSLVSSVALRFYFDNIITKIIFAIGAGWVGIAWILFSILIVYEVVRLFIKIQPSVAGVAILIIVGILTIYSMINTQFVRVKKLVIPGNTNSDIVQITDVHLGSTSQKFLQKIIDKTNTLEPNVIVITGDLVDEYNENVRKALQRLRAFKAKVFFVMGNHEMYAGAQNVADVLAEANVTVLRNQLADCNEIQIIGIDENTDLRDINFVIQRLNRNKSKFCILLTHRPISPKVLADNQIEFGLAGHFHGGQIYPFNYVVQYLYKYISGLYKEGNSSIYVSTGTGTWGPRMRLGSRSEIVHIKIRKSL